MYFNGGTLQILLGALGNSNGGGPRPSTKNVYRDPCDKNDDLYMSSPCLTRSVFILLMTSQSIADDVVITRQL